MANSLSDIKTKELFEIEQCLSYGKMYKGRLGFELHDSYVELAKEVFWLQHPIDRSCTDIPPWNRKANQITRDIFCTHRYTLNDMGYISRIIDECDGWLMWDEDNNEWNARNTEGDFSTRYAYSKAIRATEYITCSIFYESALYYEYQSAIEPKPRGMKYISIGRFGKFQNETAKTSIRLESLEIAKAYLTGEPIQKYGIEERKTPTEQQQLFTTNEWRGVND